MYSYNVVRIRVTIQAHEHSIEPDTYISASLEADQISTQADHRSSIPMSADTYQSLIYKFLITLYMKMKKWDSIMN